MNRRDFLKASALAGAGLTLFWRGNTLYAGNASRTPVAVLKANENLMAFKIPKYETPLVIPPPMPRAGKIKVRGAQPDVVHYYEIAVKQFDQFILPESLGLKTTVWSYGSARHPESFNYPSFTIEAEHKVPVRVKWINGLVDDDGQYLPHLLPIDQTLHWANPGGGRRGRDSHGNTAEPYTGPVPMVTHLHGSHTSEESDGYAEAWFLPDAKNIDPAYARAGSKYDGFAVKFWQKRGVRWEKGSATYQYPNLEPASTLWFHDHTLGMTRVNVYAGPAGFYIVRGGPYDLAEDQLPGPAPKAGDPAGTSYYEIPLAIQDRSFNTDGSLFYPNSRAFFEGLNDDESLKIPFAPDKNPQNPGTVSDVPPIWNPEFFGDTIVVNGKTWPTLNVEPRRYRFRLLNGCNSRFLVLKIAADAKERPAAVALPFWQIGAEGGFLPAPVESQYLLMSPAERADVIVDFSSLKAGTKLYLINEGADSPFGGLPIEKDDLADPETTGQVMRFVVVPLASEDTSTPPDQLDLARVTPPPFGEATVTRQVSLNESVSETVYVIEEDEDIISVSPDTDDAEPFGPVSANLGAVQWDGKTPMGMPMMWVDPPSEVPAVGATEIWEIYNFTMDAHPIHVHQGHFQMVDRQQFDMENGPVPGTQTPPEPAERGFKDTVIAYPDQITRIKVRFETPGIFVWHCHILEHEDQEMMRPFRVGTVWDAADWAAADTTEDLSFEEEGSAQP